MKTITLLEFRQNAQDVLDYIQRGQCVLLTNRGKPVARLEPVENRSVSRDDPFYALDRLADDRAKPATNEEIDRVVYGS